MPIGPDTIRTIRVSKFDLDQFSRFGDIQGGARLCRWRHTRAQKEPIKVEHLRAAPSRCLQIVKQRKVMNFGVRLLGGLQGEAL